MSELRTTDLSYLKELTGGEPEIIKEFIEMFLGQMDEFRDGMSGYLAEKKWQELGEVAHKAKSSVMTFGMNDLGHQLKELQLKTQRLEDIDSYPSYVAEFMQKMEAAEIELKEEMGRM